MANFPFFRPSVPSAQPDFFNKSAERQQRLESYKKTWQAYLSELPNSLKVEDGADDNVKVNPVRSAIEVGAYFLFGEEVRFEISPNRSDDLGMTKDQGLPDWLTKLNKTWKANRKANLLHEMAVSGGIHGDCFVKLLPNGAGVNGDLPRLIVLDPSNVDVETDPDDCEKVEKWIIEYNTENDEGKIVIRTQEITAIYAPDAIDDEEETTLTSDSPPIHWEIRNFETDIEYTSGYPRVPTFQGKRAQVGPVKIWDYPWAPIEHCNNVEIPHMFWGLPDVDDSSVDLVQTLQAANSSLAKVMRVHGSPRMYAKGLMPELAGEIDVSPDNIITLPGAGSEQDLRILSMITDISSFSEHIKGLKAQLLEQIQVPAIALGQTGDTSMSMSGINLSIMFAPIIQKTEVKRINYGDMLDRINYKLIVLMGNAPGDMYDDLEVVWPECMPGSAYLERQTLIEDQKLGLSAQTAMTRLGYDWQKEQQQMLDEKRALLELEAEFLSMQPGSESVTGADGTVKAATSPVKISGKFSGASPGGNNNPSGNGGGFGSKMGATGNSTPKNKDNPTTSASRGGPSKG